MQRNRITEPIELCILKQKLANFSCKCVNCDNYNKFYKFNNSGENAEIQVNETGSLLGRFSQVTKEPKKCDINKTDRSNGTSLINTFCKDVICPSCRYIVDFLKGSLNKVFKDEESLTKVIECCDKSTDKPIHSLDKTTSMTQKCSTCEIKKGKSVEFVSSVDYKKPEKVTFVDSENVTIIDTDSKFTSVNADKATLVDLTYDENTMVHSDIIKCPTCMCMEKFIDSIRPPITDQ